MVVPCRPSLARVYNHTFQYAVETHRDVYSRIQYGFIQIHTASYILLLQ